MHLEKASSSELPEVVKYCEGPIKSFDELFKGYKGNLVQRCLSYIGVKWLNEHVVSLYREVVNCTQTIRKYITLGTSVAILFNSGIAPLEYGSVVAGGAVLWVKEG